MYDIGATGNSGDMKITDHSPKNASGEADYTTSVNNICIYK